jgi:hypothetical protein
MPTPVEEIWKRSVRAYDARNQHDMARAWYYYYKDQAQRHRVLSDALVARHENEAARFAWALKDDGGLPPEAA